MAKIQAQAQKMSAQQKLELARQSMAKTAGTKTAAKNAAAAPQRKPRVKATETHEPVAEATVDVKLMSALDDYLAEAKASMPSWKRTLVAFILSMAAASGLGWLIGTIMGYAIIGVFAATGSMALVYLMYAFTILLAGYTGLKVSQKIGGYVLSGSIDRDISSAWKKTKDFFKRGEQLPADAVAA